MCACSKNKKKFITVKYIGENNRLLFIGGRSYNNIKTNDLIRIKPIDFDESIMEYV